MHWSDRYLGMTYVAVENDCAELAARVQREVFGRDVCVPSDRAASSFGRTVQIETLKFDYGVPTDLPADGDAVLMMSRGRLRHLGVYCLIDEPWVLHALVKPGSVVRTRIRELNQRFLKVEGYYRWKL